MNRRTIVFSLPGHEALGARLADALKAPEGALLQRQFPDGETYVRGETPCEGVDVVLAANLFQPNAQFLPLVFSVRALRGLGAGRVFLVSPYLPYMRQDARFQPGEVVTSRIFAKLLSDIVDGLVTVDPHLHRYTTLGEIYSVPTRVGHAAAAVAGWIRDNIEQAVIVGPDSESEQWVSEVADMACVPSIVLTKTRHGDRNVSIEVPPFAEWREHTPVLVDDIISTARTMMETIGHLTKAGYAAPICIGVHAVFAGDAYEALQDAGADKIISANSIPHSSNEIDLTALLVDGLRELFVVNAGDNSVQEKPS